MTDRRRGAGVWIATCAGAGYLPLIPGTAGSALGLGLVAALGHMRLTRLGLTATLAAAAVVIFIAGVWAAGAAEKFFGRKDPGQAVIDELVGQIITFLSRAAASWKWLLVGFLVFRVFDIIKPFPARRAEKLPGGWGIMLDDVVAGAYGLLTLSLLGFKFK